MDRVFLVYKTDKHHSYNSRDIIGIATESFNAIMLCADKAKQEGEKLSRYTIQFLAEKKQTQDYNGEGEFVIEEVEINKLL